MWTYFTRSFERCVLGGLPTSRIWRRAVRWSRLWDGVGTLGGIADFGSLLATIYSPIVAGCMMAATSSPLPPSSCSWALRIRVLLGRMEAIAEPE
jgi:hypothetical protein